jgi:hypothetical protein
MLESYFASPSWLTIRQCSSQYITEYSNIWVKLSNCLRRVSQKQAQVYLNELETHPNLEKNAYFYSAWGFYGILSKNCFFSYISLVEKSCKRIIEAKQVIMRGIQREAQPAIQLVKALKSLRYRLRPFVLFWSVTVFLLLSCYYNG